MKQILLMIAVVTLVGGCASTPTNWVSDPSDPNNVIIEEQIRFYAKKPTGELTKVDLDKVTSLNLGVHQLTSVKGLEKLTQLTKLHLGGNQLTKLPEGLEKLTQLRGLYLDFNQLTEVPTGLEKLTQLTWLTLLNNPALTKAQIDELQKALPKCKIRSNPTKQPAHPFLPQQHLHQSR